MWLNGYDDTSTRGGPNSAGAGDDFVVAKGLKAVEHIKYAGRQFMASGHGRTKAT